VPGEPRSCSQPTPALSSLQAFSIERLQIGVEWRESRVELLMYGKRPRPNLDVGRRWSSAWWCRPWCVSALKTRRLQSPAEPPPPAFGGEHGRRLCPSRCSGGGGYKGLDPPPAEPRALSASPLPPAFDPCRRPVPAPPACRLACLCPLPALATGPVRGKGVAVVIAARGRDSLEGQRTKNSKSFLVVKRKVIG